jgi:hypothetical protein
LRWEPWWNLLFPLALLSSRGTGPWLEGALLSRDLARVNDPYPGGSGKTPQCMECREGREAPGRFISSSSPRCPPSWREASSAPGAVGGPDKGLPTGVGSRVGGPRRQEVPFALACPCHQAPGSYAWTVRASCPGWVGPELCLDWPVLLLPVCLVALNQLQVF